MKIQLSQIKSGLFFIHTLPGIAKTILVISVMVTSVLTSYIYFQNRTIATSTTDGFPAIQKQLADISHRLAKKETDDHMAFVLLYTEITQIKNRVDSVKKKADNLAYISVANSDILSDFMPRITDMHHETFDFILSLQKDEAAARIDSLRRFGIETRKKYPSKNER